MTDDWRQEYEIAVTERNMLISGLQRLVEDLAHAGAIKQREAIALRKAMREALQELVALRHGSAMKIIEDALGDDEFCEDGDA